MYTIGFPTTRPYVIGDVVTPTLLWDTTNLTWNKYDDLSSVVTIVDYYPHPDLLVVYEHLSDGSRIRLWI